MAKSMNDRVNELQERCATLANRVQELERVANQALSFIEDKTPPGQHLALKNELRSKLSNKPTK